MKFTINIKDSKVALFIELLKNLDFVDMEEDEDDQEGVSTEEEKNIFEQRLASYRDDSCQLLTWEKVKKELCA